MRKGTAKHEGCFNQLQLHQLQCAWDNTILEAHVFRRYEIVHILLCSYGKNVLLESFPNYCHWKAITKIFKLCNWKTFKDIWVVYLHAL